MAVGFEFYDQRAKAAAKAAAAATLDNVRERELRSEQTFRGLADQALKVMQDREQADRDRQVRREAEAAAEVEAAHED
jgi:hypothetical protein